MSDFEREQREAFDKFETAQDADSVVATPWGYWLACAKKYEAKLASLPPDIKTALQWQKVYFDRAVAAEAKVSSLRSILSRIETWHLCGHPEGEPEILEFEGKCIELKAPASEHCNICVGLEKEIQRRLANVREFAIYRCPVGIADEILKRLEASK